jgi:hypothetical protein
MMAPAKKAMAAIIQSLGCIFLKKSMSFLSYRARQHRFRISGTDPSLTGPIAIMIGILHFVYWSIAMARKPAKPKASPAKPMPESEAADLAASIKAVDPKRRSNLVKAGVAVGIGSAAIVAALLYANRNKKNDR